MGGEMHEEDYAAARAGFDEGKFVDPNDVWLSQYRLAAWQGKKFGATPREQLVLGVLEEIGELSETVLALSAAGGRLARATLKHAQKVRGFGDVDLLRRAAGDALGDVMVFCAQVATTLRLDLLSCYASTARRVMKEENDRTPCKAGGRSDGGEAS